MPCCRSSSSIFPSQFDFITRQLDEFRTHSVSLGVTGTIALIWGALGVFGAISTAVNYAWGVDEQRSFWKHKLYSFLMLGLPSWSCWSRCCW